MCQYNGKLDYFVGLHTSGDLRVWSVTTDTSGIIIPQYCKSIPKTIPIESKYIMTDCKWKGTVNSMNQYIIAVGASSLDPLKPGQYNYLYAKFDTSLNITETIIQSNDPDVSERLVDVKVDLVHEQVYVILDINTNMYQGVSIFGPGDNFTENNPNIALIAYSFDNAAIQWIKILGDKSYIDYYSDLEVVDNHVIVMTNSYTTQFSSPMPSKDIILWKFRYDTGIQDYKLIMGSPTDDTSFDLISFYHGLYILATFNNNFYPHPNLGSVWGTYSNSTAFGMIWLSHDLSIVDIEGYPYSSLSTIPMRVFPSLFNEFKPQFLFISPASTVQSNGALFTQFTAPNSLFSSVDWNLTWATWDRYTKSNNWISWNIGEILYQGDWVSSWPIRSFQVVNKLTSATISHCIGCDYSCMNCLGQKKNQWTLWCSSGSCGSSLLDMNPNFGTCTCPSGTYESSGVWLDKCVNGLHGRIASKWYEFWPKNTFPIIKYDDPTNANEITHYEEANLTLCQDFNNVLKFNVTGQGIEVPGPPGLSSMLPEFTLSFWFRAELFNSETYLINLFQRVFIKVVSNKVHFIFERSSGDLIEPTYSGILNQISTNTWVYVSVSQIERKVSGNYYITQKIVIANGRSTDAVEAGSSSISAPVNYHKFVNTILIGGYNSTDFKSFTGYIKEIRLFNQFHDSPQMIVDKLRFYQIYSYDDNHLISYWRLSENFTSSDTVYKINDYSFSNMNNALNVMFSPVTNPNFPTFLYSYSLGLKLWYYHDVASWRTLANVPKIFSKGWRVTNPSNFKLTSLSHTIKYGDIINFKLGDWNTGTIKAIITNGLNSVWNPDSTYPPELLLDGVHYSMCYSAVIDGYNIDLGQMYLIKTSTKVDPSDFSSMVIIGLQIQVDVSGGDEAYGDIIRFSVDCDAPQTTDYYIERKTGLIFGMLITKNFQQSKVFKMCYLHSFAFGLDLYMDNINNHVWTASQTPTLDTTTPFSFYINDYPLSFKFSSAFTEGDTILFAWKQSSGNDCDSANFLSSSFLFKYGYLQLIWLGNDQGIHGITQQSSQVHMWWRSNAYGGDPSYLRVGLSTGQSYEFSTLGYTLASRINLPEINFIKPHYGSTEFYGTDGVLQIDFGGDNVFPAKRSGIKGSLAVYRGAVKYDGSIVMITTNPLYLITTLDEAAGTPLQQGNINWTTSGLWNVTLSAATSTGMSYGEIYFLALFPNSFSNNVASNYYLFANNTNSGSSIYNHLFMWRSFNIIASPTAKIFGTNLVIQGENLLKIDNVLAKESLGTIVTSTFTTIHIKISLSIQSTTWSTSLLPFASIYMTNVNDTYINIYNMDLKGWNNGNIYGSFELTRGIKLGLNSYGYIKTEYLDGVALGSIGWDSTCKDCTGPTANDWTICTNFATSYLYQGKCYSVWPTVAPYWMLNYKVFQSAQYAVLQWVSSWPIQYFTNTDTNEWEQWNSDCQTWASNKMASCITWNPIKYFYYGVWVEFWPSPLYTVDNTNYQWLKKNITSNLSVSIIKPPYLYKIPRNKQLYLKAYIDNS